MGLVMSFIYFFSPFMSQNGGLSVHVVRMVYPHADELGQPYRVEGAVV